jgi:hypothetical protein
MADAIESGACNGVVIERLLAAKPNLCKKVLEAKIDSTLGNLAPLPFNTKSGGTQLQQTGKGGEWTDDWSVEEEVQT